MADHQGTGSQGTAQQKADPQLAELQKQHLRAEISNLSASTQKIVSETRKLERERSLYPIVVGSGLVFALVGLLKILS